MEETNIESMNSLNSPPNRRFRSRSRSRSKSLDRSIKSQTRRSSHFDIGPDGNYKRSPFARVSMNHEPHLNNLYSDGKKESGDNGDVASFRLQAHSSHNKENYYADRYSEGFPFSKRSFFTQRSSEKKNSRLQISHSDEEVRAAEEGHDFDSNENGERKNFFISNQSQSEEQKAHDRIKMMHYIHMINLINDSNKIKKTIYLPQNSDFNYCGLIIGPKGSNIQRIEEESGCKIYIRGRNTNFGSVIDPFSAGESELQHVLVIGDCETQVSVASEIIERIIFADEETRNKIRQEQLRIVTQLRGEMMAPSSTLNKPDDDVFFIPIPSGSTGYLIGKNGETIKSLQVDSGARINVNNDPHGLDTHMKNVVIEGSKENIAKAKELIQNLLEAYHKLKKEKDILQDNEATTVEIMVPTNCLGILIGKGGENIKRLNHKSGCLVAISKEYKGDMMNEKSVVITGKPDKIDIVRREIEEIVTQNQKFMAMRVAKAVAHSLHGNGDFKKKSFNWREAVPEKIQEIFKEARGKDPYVKRASSSVSQKNEDGYEPNEAHSNKSHTFTEETQEKQKESQFIPEFNNNTEQIDKNAGPKEIDEDAPVEAQEKPEATEETIMRTSDMLYEQRSIQYMKEAGIEERVLEETQNE